MSELDKPVLSKSATNNYYVGRMAKPLCGRFEFKK
jgi:hypothetical protein